MIATVYLALGSNLGNRWQHLEAAATALPPEVRPSRKSPVYETPPWGYENQPAFLNQVLQATTNLAPNALLAYLKDLEIRLGRQPTFQYGPRTIDLDILLYDDLLLESESLTIPHPGIPTRAFVLVPLHDLAPDLRHPTLGKTIRELLEKVEQTGITRFTPGG